MLNNSAIKITGLVCLCLALFAGGYFFNSAQSAKKTTWIDLSKVYNDFSLKKDLEQKFRTIENDRKHVLDSLELHLKLLSQQLEIVKGNKDEKIYNFQKVKQEYLAKKQRFDEDDNQLRSSLNGQVLTQLNQYVKDYAKEQDISVVLGADGSGALMYARENMEITDEVLIYCNNKYKGEK